MLGRTEGWLTYLERMKKTDWKSQGYFRRAILKSYFEELAIRLIQAAAVILHPACAKEHLVTGLTANIRCTSASMSVTGAETVRMNLTYQCWLSRSPPPV